MNSKDKFLEEFEMFKNNFSEESIKYVETLKLKKNDNNTKLTELNLLILNFMRENEKESLNPLTSKEISEKILVPAKSIAGSMRKLVNMGYVEKTDSTPIGYSLTDKGRSEKIDN